MARLLPNETIVFIPELFKIIQKAPDRETRKALLFEYASKDAIHKQALRQFTELAWHPAIEWMLPEGSPPYASSTAHEGQAPNNLFKVFKVASRFLKGGGGFITNAIKRETYFITTLESLSKAESEILIALKDKNIDSIYSHVTCDLFCEVFPEWLPPEVVAAHPPKKDSDEKKSGQSSE